VIILVAVFASATLASVQRDEVRHRVNAVTGDPVPRIGMRGAPSTLALLNLRKEKLLQRFIRQPERGRFF
jgi:hypothetical protein